ncbi:MAG: HxsD-like protein [Candidatus Aenigmarchaeota archaeon]|nr:HxsD-like protein [Candidatus Aenigmarchaeota archaeon]
MRNLKINKKGKRAELELSRDFYPEHVLRKAAKDFVKVFDVDIKGKKGKFVITLKPKLKKMGIEEATYEFVNYLLAEAKNDMVRL